MIFNSSPHVNARLSQRAILFPAIAPPKRIGSFICTHPAKAGFSLVEIMLALGIISFAFMAILGLIPSGLQSFRNSVELTVEAQILQYFGGEATQTDFSKLSKLGSESPYYFDEEGQRLPSATQQALFQVNLDVKDSTALPTNSATTNVKTITINVSRYVSPTLIRPLKSFAFYVANSESKPVKALP